MKQVINGKMYNTQTSKKIGEWNNGRFTNDCYYVSEDLYIDPSGEFFLHGKGGDLSRYAPYNGNTSGWGEEIILFTKKEAEEWAADNLCDEEYEEISNEIFKWR